MLTREQIEQIVADKDKFGEFISASMVLSVLKGLEKTKSSNTPLSAVSNFLESLRKARADLTGDSHADKIPQMMVNIQFGQAPKAEPIPIEGEVTRPIKADSEEPSDKILGKVTTDFDRFFGDGNIEVGNERDSASD